MENIRHHIFRGVYCQTKPNMHELLINMHENHIAERPCDGPVASLSSSPLKQLDHREGDCVARVALKLVLNIEKCIFGVSTIEFLAHTITPEGIQPPPSKVQRVRVFPRLVLLRRLGSSWDF